MRVPYSISTLTANRARVLGRWWRDRGRVQAPWRYVLYPAVCVYRGHGNVRMLEH